MEVEKCADPTGNGAMFARYMGVDEKLLPWNAHGNEQDIGMEILEPGQNGVKIGRFEITVRNDAIVMPGHLLLKSCAALAATPGNPPSSPIFSGRFMCWRRPGTKSVPLRLAGKRSP